MSEEDAEREGKLAADQGQKQEPEGRGKTDDPTGEKPYPTRNFADEVIVAHIPNLTGADEDHVSPTNTRQSPSPSLVDIYLTA